MNRILTENEVESFKINAFNYITEINKKITFLNNQLKLYYLRRDELYEDYLVEKRKFNGILLDEIGKGKNSDILLKPNKIRNEILDIKTSGYTEYIDKEKAKKEKLLNKVLHEDYHNAINEVKKYRKKEKRIVNNYYEIKNELKECQKNIANTTKLISELDDKKHKLLKAIKKYDKAFLKNRKVNTKKMVIKK